MAGTSDTPSWLTASKSARRWACGPDRAAIAQSGHQEPSGCAYRCQTTLRHGNSCVAERRGQMESGGSTAPLFTPHGLHQHLGSHIANLIAAAKGSTWIELRNAGLRQGISKFPQAAGIRHLTYVNDRFNSTSGKWPRDLGDRKQCEDEATEFRLGDSRRRIKRTWPPCFMNWNLEVHIPKLERLLRTVLIT